MLRWLLFAAALFVAAAAPARADDLQRILDSQAVKIGVCLDAEPAGYRDSNGQPRGYDVDVATLVAQSLGVRLDLVQITSATRISSLLEGHIDIIACNITATAERAKTIDFSFPYLRTGIKLLVQRDSGIGGFADIGADTRLLVGRGTTGETMARDRAPAAQLLFVENPGDAELLMRLREADAYIEDSLVVDYIAKAHADQLLALPESYSVDAIAFGVRKGNPDFLRWLDLFTSIYVSSGKYAETYGKWWGEPPPPLTPVW
jgi:polar amino acid transport system substrate-binding protein